MPIRIKLVSSTVDGKKKHFTEELRECEYIV